MDRVETTLFMLMSVDGKISTGDIDGRDYDKDLSAITGVKEGLQQYYDLEQETDLLSFNTGRVMAKVGVNERVLSAQKTPVSFVIVDNEPHLNTQGIRALSSSLKKLFIITTNDQHPAEALAKELDNVSIIKYEKEIDFTDLFRKLKNEYDFPKMTIQSGGTMNAILLRSGLIDHLSIVVAPMLVGGKNVSTLVDGESLKTEEDLLKIRPLKLIECKKLEHSYLNLLYDVIN